MIVSSSGIVVRTYNYRESSKIVDVFTESDGIVSLLAKGIRKSRKIVGVLEPLNIVFLSYYKKTTKELYLLSKVETISSFHRLIFSFDKLACGLAIIELVVSILPKNSPNKFVFSLTKSCIEALKNEHIQPSLILVYYLLNLLKEFGIDFTHNLDNLNRFEKNKRLYFDYSLGRINLNPTSDSDFLISFDVINLLYQISKMELNDLQKLTLVPFDEVEVVKFFESYLSFHLGKRIIFRTFELFGYGF
ncbi:MAG: DNA repair protein RecO [Ignavibacteria bacterium]|nr:DNA repair protein RecO [Ignavibacteria bacterium]